jgi:hypothetical protein
MGRHQQQLVVRRPEEPVATGEPAQHAIHAECSQLGQHASWISLQGQG